VLAADILAHVPFWMFQSFGRAKEGLSIVENSLAEMSDESEAYNTLPDLIGSKANCCCFAMAIQTRPIAPGKLSAGFDPSRLASRILRT